MSSINKSRRQFIATSAAASGLAIAGCSPASKPKEDKSSVNSGGNTKANIVKPTGTVCGFAKAQAGRFFVGITNLDTRKITFSQNIEFLGHGLSRNPVKPDSGVAFEKHGPGCAQIDLKTGNMLKKIHVTAGRQFYGHGAFSPDGKTLYSAETEVENLSYKGVVGVRDGESFEYKHDFPTYGLAPHDCHLVDDGETLVFTNGGGAFGTKDFGCVTYVDVKTKAHKKTVKISDPELNAGHMTFLSNGDFVVVSAPRKSLNKRNAPGNISFYDRATGQLRIADDPIRRKMLLETLSIAVHEPSGIVAATNPSGNIVTFWDFKSGKLVHSTEDFTKPRGVALTSDGAHFVVTHKDADQNGNAVLLMTLLDAQTLMPVSNGVYVHTFVSGSHVLVM
jgi:hypothetical protein